MSVLILTSESVYMKTIASWSELYKFDTLFSSYSELLTGESNSINGLHRLLCRKRGFYS